MQLLFFEWNSFLNEGIEAALKNLDIDYTVYRYQFDDWEKDDRFLELFTKEVRKTSPDLVLSVNYSPLIAQVCLDSDTEYAAWIYDSPIHIRSRKELFYPTTHLFCFDRGQAKGYESLGVWARHLPLAASPKLFLREMITQSDREKYSSQISFVGQLYHTDYSYYMGPLTDYQRGFLEGILHAQGKVYGAYFLPELISEDFLAGMNRQYQKASDGTAGITREELEYMLACEVTARERYLILALLSRHFQVRHFARTKDERLKDVTFMGYADYRTQMPKIFQLSEINLNITLKTIQTGIPLRALDILACGGFLLSNYQEELAEYFRIGEELAVYSDVEELVYLCDYYLKHADERKQIAKAGQMRVLEAFSYEQAVLELLSEL